FGVAHSSNEQSMDIFDVINKIVNQVEVISKKHNYPKPKISIEPGRSIISTAGTTLYTVGAIKKSASKKYAIVDGGMADNIRPSLYNAKYQAYVANKMKETEDFEKVTIAGRACDSGDILIDEIFLPRLSIGDLLAIPFTGDYTYSMSSNYNGFLRPAIVLVNNGKNKLITRRETYDDLLSRDITKNDWHIFD
ncbi:MAG: diaminopimelate decarboxylase, partial [Defluviitoga tunisiensis]